MHIQRIMSFGKTRTCQCIRLEVVWNGWNNDGEVLDGYRCGEGVMGYNNGSNQDRVTRSQLCLRWKLCRTSGATTAKYLMSTARRGDSRVQQHIQLKQSDNRSTLLEMEAVQNVWGDDGKVLDVKSALS